MSPLKKIILLVILFVAILLTNSYRNKNQSHLILGQHHATWTRSLFFRGYTLTTGEPLTMSEIKDFATTLKNNNIEYAYIFSGPYGKDGFLPDWAFSDQAIQSIKEIKKYYPEVKILPWVGGIYGRTVYVDNKTWRENALASTKKLVETLSVDGVHFDFERFQGPLTYNEQGISTDPDLIGKQYAEGVLQFHRELRDLMPKLFVSSVVVSTAKDTRPWKRKHTLEELKQLFPLVDQISFLYYDTSIKDAEVFRSNMLEQLSSIKEIQDSTASNPQVLIAIGTFINDPSLVKYRDMNIENIPNTLNVLKEGLSKVQSSTPLVDGLAIYCEWHTDAEEWRLIRENWPVEDK